MCDEKQVLARSCWGAIFRLVDKMRDEVWFHTEPEKLNDLLGITLAQRRVCATIQYLSETQPAGPSLKEVADSLGLTPGTVSTLVENLVRKGWVVREACTDDRRVVRLRFAEQSLELLKRRCDFFTQFTQDFFGDFTPGELEAFLRMTKMFSEIIPINQEVLPNEKTNDVLCRPRRCIDVESDRG